MELTQREFARKGGKASVKVRMGNLTKLERSDYMKRVRRKKPPQ